MHAAADVVPASSLYLPPAHALQAEMAAPSKALYLPAAHGSQAVPALFDALPAGQREHVLTGQKLSLGASDVADANIAPDES